VRLLEIARVELNVTRGVRAGFILLLFVVGGGALYAQIPYSVEIDLQQQMAFLIRGGRQVILQSPISSGRYGHLTETGSFKVIEKERNHHSSIYGQIVDAQGNVIVADADVDMHVPRGGRFLPAPMRYFMRFHGADGMHAGYLPGYPASHGCVRMPENLAIAFFQQVEVGTPVRVFGRTPRTRDYYQYGPQPFGRSRIWQGRPVDPRFGPRYIDPRYVDPWWR
jgi:L,D-transpeptidase catalytic domain